MHQFLGDIWSAGLREDAVSGCGQLPVAWLMRTRHQTSSAGTPPADADSDADDGTSHAHLPLDAYKKH